MADILHTNDLLLRTACEAFAPLMRNYYLKNKAFLAPFEPKRDAQFYTLPYQQAILAQDAASAADGSAVRYYIFRKAEPETVIGSIALSNIVRGNFQSCFMGYKLDYEFVNRGYMTQAVQAMVNTAFTVLQLHRIEANIMPRNLPSRRVLEKCGFTAEGVSPQYLQIHGVWEDHLHMVRLHNVP